MLEREGVAEFIAERLGLGDRSRLRAAWSTDRQENLCQDRGRQY
jgi:hypothetical protein